jgi:hypothetical protein
MCLESSTCYWSSLLVARLPRLLASPSLELGLYTFQRCRYYARDLGSGAWLPLSACLWSELDARRSLEMMKKAGQKKMDEPLAKALGTDHKSYLKARFSLYQDVPSRAEVLNGPALVSATPRS